MRRYYYADNVVMSITSVADVGQETNVSVQLLIGELPAAVTGVEVPITFVKSQYNLLTRYAYKIEKQGVYYVLTFNKADFSAEERDTFLVQGQRCEIRLTATELNDFATMFYNHTLDDKLWMKETGDMVQFFAVPGSPVDVIAHLVPVEILPSEGEKSPSNPSKIVGTTSIDAIYRNVNLINVDPKTVTRGGLTVQYKDDGTVWVNGTNTSGTYQNFRCPTDPFSPKGKKFHLSGCPAGGSTSTYYMYMSDGIRNVATDTGQGVVSALCEGDAQNVYISIQPDASFINVIFKPQLTLGETRHPFTPAVSQWLNVYFGDDKKIGGDYNFNTGLYTETYQQYSLHGDEDTRWSDLSRVRITGSTSGFCAAGVGTDVICTHFKHTVVDSGTINFTYQELNKYGITTPEEFLAFAEEQYNAGKPITVSWKSDIFYCKDFIRTEQYPAQPVTAWPSNSKFEPVASVVYCASSHQLPTTVVYAKSPVKEHEDITNAILSLGGANV